jgi:hypothetical protein
VPAVAPASAGRRLEARGVEPLFPHSLSRDVRRYPVREDSPAIGGHLCFKRAPIGNDSTSPKSIKRKRDGGTAPRLSVVRFRQRGVYFLQRLSDRGGQRQLLKCSERSFRIGTEVLQVSALDAFGDTVCEWHQVHSQRSASSGVFSLYTRRRSLYIPSASGTGMISASPY